MCTVGKRYVVSLYKGLELSLIIILVYTYIHKCMAFHLTGFPWAYNKDYNFFNDNYDAGPNRCWIAAGLTYIRGSEHVRCVLGDCS